MRFIAVLTALRAVIERILTHVGLSAARIVAAPARHFDDTSGCAGGHNGGNGDRGRTADDVRPRLVPRGRNIGPLDSPIERPIPRLGGHYLA